VAEIVDIARRVLAAGPPLRLAVLFGSHATGRARPDSDVDIAILPIDPDLDFHQENRLATELAWALGREVDLVRADRVPTYLKWHIARDGKLLLAAPPSELTRFRAAAASEYADFAPALAHAGRLFARRLTRSAS
jgi:uncharacterized protein